MANSIPLTFRSAPLPEDYSATPEQFKNDIVARLYAETTDSISFFASGSIAPTSNVGPWLKNGVEWWIWDDGVGGYIPQPTPQISLKYIAQINPPDPNDYILWIELNGAGKAIALKYYSGGAWKDVYEDKFALYYTSVQTDAAIQAALDARSNYPAKGVTGVYGQLIPTTNTAQKVNLSVAAVNPYPAPFDTAQARYIAPVNGFYSVAVSSQFDNVTGAAATMEISLALWKNGAFVGTALSDLDSTPNPTGGRWSPGFSGLIPLNQGDYIEIWAIANDGVGAGNVRITVAQLSVVRVG